MTKHERWVMAGLAEMLIDSIGDILPSQRLCEYLNKAYELLGYPTRFRLTVELYGMGADKERDEAKPKTAGEVFNGWTDSRSEDV